MTTTGDADIGSRLGYLEGRMDEQSVLLQQIVSQMEQMDGRFDQVNGRFDQVNGRFDQVNDRIDRVNDRIDRVNDRIDESIKEINAGFQRLYLVAFGIGGTIMAGLIGIIGLLVALIL